MPPKTKANTTGPNHGPRPLAEGFTGRQDVASHASRTSASEAGRGVLLSTHSLARAETASPSR